MKTSLKQQGTVKADSRATLEIVLHNNLTMTTFNILCKIVLVFSS